MSVRVYQLSKEIGMDNSELIQLLRDRGHDVKSASSTVDNISADSLRVEYGSAGNQEGAKTDAIEPVTKEAEEPRPPQGAIVRTREEIEKDRAERERVEAERRAAAQPPAVQPPQPRAPGNQPPAVPPAPVGKAPPAVRQPLQPGRVPPPVVQPRFGTYSGPPSRSVTRPAMPVEERNEPVRNEIRAPATPEVKAPPRAPEISRQAPHQPEARNAPPRTPEVRNAPPRPPEERNAPRQPEARNAPPRPPEARNAPPRQPEQPRRQAEPQQPPAAQPISKQPPVPAREPERPKTPPAPPPAAGPPPVASTPPRAGNAPPRTGMPPRVSAPPRVGGAPEQPARETAPQAPAGKDTRPRIQVKPPIVVRDFAVQIGKKPFQLISELMEMNIFASMNQVIEEDVARRIAEKHGFSLEVKHRGEAQPQQKKEEPPKKVEEQEQMEPRPPVVCILGHVDHGKTTLLDTIRKTNVVAGEAGGITQHIGAYQVDRNGRLITFIDTPGHAAFSNMRARGANVTDIAVLVVAADDGFMPQTDEALGHARHAQVPVVVAINKTDMPGANVDRVRRQMQERGLTPEEWGGETLSVPVSAIKGDGIETLLDSILLQAEVTEGIEGNPKANAEGVVIEAQKETGIGPTASVIVERGTIKRGDSLVCGPHYCRIRTLIDDKGQQMKSATPGTPVKIVGWSGTPDAGDTFVQVKNEREAKRISEENEHQMKLDHLHAEQESQNTGRASIDDLFAAIAQTRTKSFRVVVKADVFGTAEALAVALEQIKSTKITLEVVDMGVGAVSKNDILMASAAGAAIVAFAVNMENGVAPFAKHHSIRLFQHEIIYELITQVKDAMADQLEPELRENKTGAAEVRQVFPVAKGNVAGCMVTEGRVNRGGLARLLRKGQILGESRVSTLRRFKEDATEVRAGYECGIQLDNLYDYQVGDIIECFEILKIKALL